MFLSSQANQSFHVLTVINQLSLDNQLMYQSIPSLTIPRGGDFFEMANSPPRRDFFEMANSPPPGNFLKWRIPHPRGIFEKANSPPPGHKESAKPRPLRQKNCAKIPAPDNDFQKYSKKNTQNMRQKLRKTVMKC